MPSRVLVLDSCVVIDYAACGERVLSIAAQHFAGVVVLVPLLREVRQLDEQGCRRHGLRREQPMTEQVLEAAAAANQPGQRLSFEDHLCRIYARDAGCTCVSNDSRLRRECRDCGVPILWGLELMLELVRAGRLLKTEAQATADRIAEANGWLGAKALEAFRRGLSELP